MSKPGRNGANFSSLLRAFDVASHESRRAGTAHAHRGKEQLRCAGHRGALRNDGTPQNADLASPVEADRDLHRYNLKHHVLGIFLIRKQGQEHGAVRTSVGTG